MNSIAIIFLYTDKDELTKINLEALKYNNPNVPIFDICQRDFNEYHYQFLDIKPIKYWTSHDVWYWGSDNIFIHWYLSNTFRAKNYLIIEGDTFSKEMSIHEFFGAETIEKNTGITCVKLTTYKENPNYYWFQEQRDNYFINQIYTKDNLKSCMPLCGTLISNNCVEAVISHISENYFSNKLFVETKFGTIASYLGFNIEEYKNPIQSFIDYKPETVVETIDRLCKTDKFQGIFHPVKNLSTIQNAISNQKIDDTLSSVKTKINKAFYGKLVDVKSSIEKLHEIIPKEKIEINNFLAGDPVPGVKKELYLTYKKNNQIFETTIPEGEFLDYNNL